MIPEIMGVQNLRLELIMSETDYAVPAVDWVIECIEEGIITKHEIDQALGLNCADRFLFYSGDLFTEEIAEKLEKITPLKKKSLMAFHELYLEDVERLKSKES